MRVVIFGTGENSAQAWHILLHQADVEVIGFLDDDVAKHGSLHFGRPVIGGQEQFASLRAAARTRQCAPQDSRWRRPFIHVR